MKWSVLSRRILTMGYGRIRIFFTTSVLFFVSTTVGRFNQKMFFPTLKPMHCHDIQISSVRSDVDCALTCRFNIYSCLGYSIAIHIYSGNWCHVCFIYDVKLPMSIAPTASSNITSFMSVLSKQDGKGTNQPWNPNINFPYSQLPKLIKMERNT